MAEEETEYRGRVLLAPKQREAGQPVPRGGGGGEDSPVRIEVLVEFTRALIRNNPNTDVLFLSLAEARQAADASEEEVELLKIAVLGELLHSSWPDGFF